MRVWVREVNNISSECWFDCLAAISLFFSAVGKLRVLVCTLLHYFLFFLTGYIILSRDTHQMILLCVCSIFLCVKIISQQSTFMYTYELYTYTHKKAKYTNLSLAGEMLFRLCWFFFCVTDTSLVYFTDLLARNLLILVLSKLSFMKVCSSFERNYSKLCIFNWANPFCRTIRFKIVVRFW